MNFGEHIIYVDESGDHGLTSIDPQYPIFVLAFCIFRKSAYVSELAPALAELKFRWFGHDSVVLHEHEIRRGDSPFVFLGNPEKRDRFMVELGAILDAAPMKIVVSVIRKERLQRRYTSPNSPYELALLFCMERAREYLDGVVGERDRLTHIVCESRGGSGGKEDRELELEFLRISAGQNRLRRSGIPGFQIVFADKKTNSAGLQVADLIARPIGVHTLRPDQPNRAYQIIEPKILARKIFP